MRRNIEAYRRKWGIPDWHDANSYWFTDVDWRWEFVRRSDKYRDSWSRWNKLLQQMKDHFLKNDNWFAKYGLLDGPVDPTISGLDPFTPLDCFSPGVIYFGGPMTRARHIRFPDIAIALDFSKPAPKQMRRMEKSITALQKRWQTVKDHRKEEREKWGLYLRALDAEAEGVDFSEIGRVLHPSKQTRNVSRRGTQLLEAAHKLQTSLLYTK